MSIKNEIMDELYRIKDEYGAKFDYNLERMVRDLQEAEEIEKRNGRRFVSFPPRRCRPEFPFTPIEEEPRSTVPPIEVLPLASDVSTVTHAQ